MTELVFPDVIGALLAFLPKLISALIIFVVGLVLSRFLSRLVEEWAERRIEQVEIQALIMRITRWATVIAFTIAALEQVDFDVTAFLTGLGIAGLTVGFALQDIARNFVAGIIVMARRPFRVGHAVKLGDYTGQIVSISTRDTTIATWDGERIIIPNQTVLAAAIHNTSIAPRLRRTVMVGVGYGQDIERVKEILVATISSVEGVLSEPAPMGHAERLGDYAVTVALRYWVNHHESNVLDVASNVIVALDKAVRDHGIELPYPIQEVRVANPPLAR